MCPLWSDETLLLFLMFILKFSTFEEKIEAPFIPVLSLGASIRENTVFLYFRQTLAYRENNIIEISTMWLK